MSLRDLIVSNRPHNELAEERRHHPLDLFRRDVGRWVDDFFDEFGILPFSTAKSHHRETFMPKVDFHEDDKKMELTAELPGMDEKDIKVSIKDQVLSIKGEKKFEKEDKSDDYHHIERSYGSFERAFRLDSDVDPEKVKAKYKNGVLTVTMPKAEMSESQVKQIEVQSS